MLLSYSRLSLVFIVLIAVFGAQRVAGQASTATLAGVVVDASSAGVPDVMLTLVNTDTSIERQTRTNHEGAFTLPFVLPGRYAIVAERDGFAPSQVRDLNVNVGDHLAIRIALKIGSLTDTVTVVAEPRGVTRSPAMGAIVDRELIAQLPLNGRSIQSLLALTPGAVATPSDLRRLGQFSVNGQRETANQIAVDGVSANLGVSVGSLSFTGIEGQYAGYNALGSTSGLVSLDAIDEFVIHTSSYAPEYGRTPGAQVSIVTRRGSDRYTASAFEYFRDDALDANDWFADRRGLPKAELRQHIFGATLGGPIIKGRTFFFTGYEGTRLRLPQVGIMSVPDAASRQMATGVAKAVFDAFPAPTGAATGPGLAEYAGTWSDPSTSNNVNLRVDHHVSGWHLFGRFGEARSSSASRSASTNSPSVLTATRINSRTFTLGLSWLPNAKTATDVRINYSHLAGDRTSSVDAFDGAVVPTSDNLLPSPWTTSSAELGVFLTSAFRPLLRYGSTGDSVQRQAQVVTSTTVSAGAHELRAGLDYRLLMPTVNFGDGQAVVFFRDVPAAIAGQTNFAILTAYDGPLRPRFGNFSAFVQHTWRVSPRLTLTYGVRWDVNPAPTERDDRGIRTATGLSDPATASLAPAGAPLWRTDWNNVGPRASGSYVVRDDDRFGTVLSAGTGLYYDLGTGSTGSAYRAFNYPFRAQKTVVGVTYPLVGDAAALPPFVDAPPYEILAFDPNLQLPRTWQWHASVQQTLGSRHRVTAAYVGAAGRGLYRLESYRQPSATFSDLDVTTNAGWSDYRALQLQHDSRWGAGLRTLASYTWSSSTDTESSDIGAGNLPASRSAIANDVGPSDFDVRHSGSAAVVWAMPGGARGWRTLTNDWTLSAMFRARSGLPINVHVPVARNSQQSVQRRPDLVPGVPLTVADGSAPGGWVLNRNAFAANPTATTHGSLGRNAVRGFGAAQVDVSLARTLPLGRARADLRLEVFNVFNRANFADPSGNLNATNFGVSTQMLNRGLGGLNPLYQFGGPRSVQLSLRLSY